jgi:hypothetical protein
MSSKTGRNVTESTQPKARPAAAKKPAAKAPAKKPAGKK